MYVDISSIMSTRRENMTSQQRQKEEGLFGCRFFDLLRMSLLTWISGEFHVVDELFAQLQIISHYTIARLDKTVVIRCVFLIGV